MATASLNQQIQLLERDLADAKKAKLDVEVCCFYLKDNQTMFRINSVAKLKTLAKMLTSSMLIIKI